MISANAIHRVREFCRTVVITACCMGSLALSDALADGPAPPAPSIPPATKVSAADDARLRGARQALTIARNECLSRLRQTQDFKELSQKLQGSQRDRERARESGTAQQQIDAEEAHLKFLLAIRDLMVSAMNADPEVAEAKAELQAVEAACAREDNGR